MGIERGAGIDEKDAASWKIYDKRTDRDRIVTKVLKDIMGDGAGQSYVRTLFINTQIIAAIKSGLGVDLVKYCVRARCLRDFSTLCV